MPHHLQPAKLRLLQNGLTSAGSGFDEQVGSVETTSGEHLRDGLWAASQVFSSAKMRASKRLMVFTTEQDPSSGDSTAR